MESTVIDKVDDPFSETLDGYRSDTIIDSTTFLENKYIKKYGFIAAFLGIGLLYGSSVVVLGIFGGGLAGLGTKLGLDRLRESSPSLYNWVLDNPGWVEVISMFASAGIFGLTLGGVFTSLVANLTTTVVLDYYAEVEGKEPGVEKLTFRGLLFKMFNGIRKFISSLKSDIRETIKQIKTPEVKSEASVVFDASNQLLPLPCAA